VKTARRERIMRLGWLLLLASALSLGSAACAFSPVGDGESGSDEESSPRARQNDELEVGTSPGENSPTATSIRGAVGPVQETRAEPEPQPWRPTRAQTTDNGSGSTK
jgi:hypothetical protein